MELVVFYGVYLLGALLLAVSSVMITGFTLHMGTKKPDGFLIFFFAPLMLVIMMDPLFAGRNLDFVQATVAGGESSSSAVKWTQRAVSIFLLAASVERLANFALKPRQADRPILLMVAFAACWVSTVALPAALGVRPTIEHDYLYWLIIGLGGLTTTESGARTAIRVARDALFLFVLAGLAALAVKRSLVLQPYIGGLFGGFSWRYSGLAVGPNQMGPITLLLMICLACFPYQRRWISVLAWVCSVVTLVLTQSKTSWMAGIACFAVIWIVRQRGRVGGFIVNPRNRLLSQLALALFGLLVIACMFLLGSGILESRIDRFLATRVGSDMANLTGRSDIWRIAIDTFLENPWFGYGPNIWDPYFRYVIGLNVFHAHNQLLNVLAASGIIGALGFLWFIWALAARLLSRFDAFGGFTAALATMILLRCISEVPFTFHSFASEALTPMLLLVALAGAPRSPKSRGQRPAVTGEPIPDAK